MGANTLEKLAAPVLVFLIFMAVLSTSDAGAARRVLPCDHIRDGSRYFFIPTGEIGIARRVDERRAAVTLGNSSGVVECKFLTTTSGATLPEER